MCRRRCSRRRHWCGACSLPLRWQPWSTGLHSLAWRTRVHVSGIFPWVEGVLSVELVFKFGQTLLQLLWFGMHTVLIVVLIHQLYSSSLSCGGQTRCQFFVPKHVAIFSCQVDQQTAFFGREISFLAFYFKYKCCHYFVTFPVQYCYGSSVFRRWSKEGPRKSLSLFNEWYQNLEHKINMLHWVTSREEM